VTDADLVDRARQGDPAAFGELVDRHRTAVYRAALAALGSHADADDVAQETFVAAYRRLSSFRGDASFKTWLLTIAWNQSINRRRSLVRVWAAFGRPPSPYGLQRTSAWAGRGTGEDTVEVEVATAAHESPEARFMSDELGRAIRGAIRALPAKLRDTLLLAQSGEHTYEEIAAMVGSPVGTIKWRVSEARRVIKSMLREQGHDVA
jgi:RNA polymerase sigma-70 factor (ECF subfamily)